MTDDPTRDSIQRFHFERLDIRGEIAHLDRTWQTVNEAHDYPEPVQRLLGELLAATALLANTIKVNGTLTVQAQGDGDIALLMAECHDRETLRGIARLRGEPPATAAVPGVPMGTELLGRGLLTITIRPEGREPYQGIVPLTGDTIAGMVEGYFRQSEQIPTRLWLSAEADQAAGMLIQALPPEMLEQPRPPAQQEEDFSRVTLLADTVTAPELREIPNEQLLTRLFHEERVRVQPADALAFACTCSRERTRQALRTLPREELESILEEDGVISMDCQFCHTAFEFDAIDIDLLDREQPPEPGPTH